MSDPTLDAPPRRSEGSSRPPETRRCPKYYFRKKGCRRRCARGGKIVRTGVGLYHGVAVLTYLLTSRAAWTCPVVPSRRRSHSASAMLAFVSTYTALLVPHLGRPAVQRPACRSAASRMLEEADIPEAFKRKSKRPAPVPQILLVDREGDEVRFVMEGGKLSLYVDDELFCGAIDTLTYSRDDGVVSVEDEVCPPALHGHGVHMACTWRPPALHGHGVHMACTWRAHGVHMACTWRAHGVHTWRALHRACSVRPSHPTARRSRAASPSVRRSRPSRHRPSPSTGCSVMLRGRATSRSISPTRSRSCWSTTSSRTAALACACCGPPCSASTPLSRHGLWLTTLTMASCTCCGQRHLLWLAALNLTVCTLTMPTLPIRRSTCGGRCAYTYCGRTSLLRPTPAVPAPAVPTPVVAVLTYCGHTYCGRTSCAGGDRGGATQFGDRAPLPQPAAPHHG